MNPERSNCRDCCDGIQERRPRLLTSSERTAKRLPSSEREQAERSKSNEAKQIDDHTYAQTAHKWEATSSPTFSLAINTCTARHPAIGPKSPRKTDLLRILLMDMAFRQAGTGPLTELTPGNTGLFSATGHCSIRICDAAPLDPPSAIVISLVSRCTVVDEHEALTSQLIKDCRQRIVDRFWRIVP